jgi:hypothetical protein
MVAVVTETLEREAGTTTTWWSPATRLPAPYVAVHRYSPDAGMETGYWDGRTWRRMNGAPDDEPTHWAPVRRATPPTDPISAWLRATLEGERERLENLNQCDRRVQWDRRVNQAHRALLERHEDGGDGNCRTCMDLSPYLGPKGRATIPFEPGDVPAPCLEVRILAACYAGRTGYRPEWAPPEGE